MTCSSSHYYKLINVFLRMCFKANLVSLEKVEKTRAEIKAIIDREQPLDVAVHQGSHLAVKQQTALLQQRLGELSAASENLAELKRLKEELAVVGQQEEHQAECTVMEETVVNLMRRASESLNELHKLDERWSEVHRKLEVTGRKIRRNESDLLRTMQDDKCTASQRRTSIQVRLRQTVISAVVGLMNALS